MVDQCGTTRSDSNSFMMTVLPRPAPRADPLSDLCLQPPDEAAAHRRDRSHLQAEGLAPLGIREPGEQLARPPHVGWRDPVSDEFLMPAVILELDEAVLDPFNEAAALECVHISACRCNAAGTAESRSQIRTTYHRSVRPADGRNSYSVLFEFLRSELLNISRMTSSPS